MIGFFLTAANPPAANAQTEQDRYSVQFRLPLDKNEVWNFVEMISGLGYPSYMYTEESGGTTYYYAQMGSYASIVDAIDAASALNKKVSIEYDVVHTNTNSIVKLGTEANKKQEAKVIPPKKPETQTTESSGNQEEYDEPVIAAPSVANVSAPQAPEPPKAPEKPATPAMTAASPASDTAPAAAQEKEVEKVYLLQIFSFQMLNNAVQTAKNYKNKGYTPLIIKLYDSQDKEWFIVSVGYAKSQAQASKLADSFAKKEGKRPTLNNVDADFLKTRSVPYE